MSIATELAKLVNVFREWPHPEPTQEDVVYTINAEINLSTFEIESSTITRDITYDQLNDILQNNPKTRFYIIFEGHASFIGFGVTMIPFGVMPIGAEQMSMRSTIIEFDADTGAYVAHVTCQLSDGVTGPAIDILKLEVVTD